MARETVKEYLRAAEGLGLAASRPPPSEDQAGVRKANSGEDRLAVTAGADQGAQRRGADVDHRSRLDSREDRGRRERKLDAPQDRVGGKP